MWQKKWAELLRDEIEAVLVSLDVKSNLKDLVKIPLTKPRRGLAANVAYDKPWSLLPLMVCEAISRNYEHALPIAATLQLLMGAGDVFDDIEDADSPESLPAKYGSALAVNAATTLLMLAEKAMIRLKKRGVDDNTIIQVVDVVNSCFIIACTGQHLDLSLILNKTISEEVYLEIIAMKSASQIECACHTGALLATTDRELIKKFAVFGRHLGMAAQITNDIEGVIRGNDIDRQKLTLPVIYALNQTTGEAHSQLEAAYSEPNRIELNPAPIKDLLFRSGAVHYAAVKLEYYKQQALDVLVSTEAAGADTKRLRFFLE